MQNFISLSLVAIFSLSSTFANANPSMHPIPSAPATVLEHDSIAISEALSLGALALASWVAYRGFWALVSLSVAVTELVHGIHRLQRATLPFFATD
jgi:hypothetical protein